MRSRPANVVGALAGVLPILAVCAVSLAHAAAAPRGAHPSAQASIVGGKEALPGQFPSLAFVADFPPGSEFVTACTGTVLTPRVILTAAHCTYDEETKAPEDPAGYVVATGTVNWTLPEGRQLSKVTRLIPYPKWATGTGRDGFGDAALLVLETPTTAPPVPIATPANKRLIKIGTRGVIAGWGNTTAEQKEFTEKLMWAHTTIGSDRCEGLWGRLCAIDFPEGRSGACHGDSGGPLFVHRRGGKGWVEVGLTEAGFGKCSTRRAQLYTRTDLLAKWIGKQIVKVEAEATVPSTASP